MTGERRLCEDDDGEGGVVDDINEQDILKFYIFLHI